MFFFLDRISKNSQLSDFMTICRVGVGLFHVDSKTDIHDEANNSFSQYFETSKTFIGGNICVSVCLSVHLSFDIIFQTAGAIFLTNFHTNISLSLSGKSSFQPQVDSYLMLAGHNGRCLASNPF
jgi:hypothetical protein